jgi:hypothetical protein
VLAWATAGDGPPPTGDLSQTEALARPEPALVEAAGHLATVTAARMRLGWPPLDGSVPPGDPLPISLGVVVLAAAIGTRHVPELAALLLRIVEPAGTPVEWVARHGLVAPALGYLTADLADELRLRSPLTALLDRPVAHQTSQPLRVARSMLAHPRGRLALQLALARPTPDTVIRQWRRELLDRLRTDGATGVGFVLDVYEATLIHHSREALDQVAAARATLGDEADDRRLEDALAVARWWGPLWALERSHGDALALRRRRYFNPDYLKGVALYRVVQRLWGDWE